MSISKYFYYHLSSLVSVLSEGKISFPSHLLSCPLRHSKQITLLWDDGRLLTSSIQHLAKSTSLGPSNDQSATICGFWSSFKTVKIVIPQSLVRYQATIMNEPLTSFGCVLKNPLPAQIHGGCCFLSSVLGVGHVKSFGSLGQVKETGRNDFAKPIIRKHPKPPRTSCLEINHFKVYPGDFPDQPDSRSFWEDSS